MRTVTAAQPSAVASGAERRRFPRVELLSELHGTLVAYNVRVVVKEASEGGFSVESPVAFPIGAQQIFRFQNKSGESTVVLAVCRNCRPVSGSDARARYRGGFEFLRQPSENLQLVRQTIRALADR